MSLPVEISRNPSYLGQGKRKLSACSAAQTWLPSAVLPTLPHGRAELGSLPDVGVLGDEAQHLQAEQSRVFEAEQLPHGKHGLEVLLAPVQALKGRAGRR